MKSDNSRTKRLQTIRNLIVQKQIGNQADLLTELEALGYKCTQATLSRDLNLLKVRKTTDSLGVRRYILPKDERYRRVMDNAAPIGLTGSIGFLSLNVSGNIAVIRTRPGYAPSIAYHIDECGMPDILGTIAGDDTIFCVLREGISQEDLVGRLYSVLK